jgi:hypothetical protein
MAVPMFCARVRSPLLPEFLSIGFCISFAMGVMVGMSAAEEAPPTEQPKPVAVAPVHISISTLDMARLVPAQFGDWDMPPSQDR